MGRGGCGFFPGQSSSLCDVSKGAAPLRGVGWWYSQIEPGVACKSERRSTGSTGATACAAPARQRGVVNVVIQFKPRLVGRAAGQALAHNSPAGPERNSPCAQTLTPTVTRSTPSLAQIAEMEIFNNPAIQLGFALVAGSECVASLPLRVPARPQPRARAHPTRRAPLHRSCHRHVPPACWEARLSRGLDALQRQLLGQARQEGRRRQVSILRHRRRAAGSAASGSRHRGESGSGRCVVGLSARRGALVPPSAEPRHSLSLHGMNISSVAGSQSGPPHELSHPPCPTLPAPPFPP